MAKDTVEDSKVLDVWKLAREGWLEPGKVCISSWSRGDEVTGTISFLAMDGHLRFRYTQTSRWTDETREHDYIVWLERTPARFGGERVWFVCPPCVKRVRMLYLPPSGGRFACRGCHDLAYERQHQSRTYRAMDRLFSLADPAPSLAQFIARSDAFDVAHAATIGRWEERSRRAKDQRASQLRGPGRPSKRELRERARLERQANRPPKPEVARPRGRPKVKRAYVHREPAPILTKHESDRQAYCVRCRDRRELKWPRLVTIGNGRSMLRGRCRTCGAKAGRLVSSVRQVPTVDGQT